MPSPQLTNYLRTSRKRLELSQEEVAFMLGYKGEDKGVKVCRDERLVREPSLRIALAYEAIYDKPIRELFAGLYQEIKQEVADRAKILICRKEETPKPERHRTLTNLISKTSAN